MLISIHELREEERRLLQQEEQHNVPASQEPEPPTGVLKFIRFIAQG